MNALQVVVSCSHVYVGLVIILLLLYERKSSAQIAHQSSVSLEEVYADSFGNVCLINYFGIAKLLGLDASTGGCPVR